MCLLPRARSEACGITQDNLVAVNEGGTKLLTFDFKTQKWSNLVAGNIVDWNMSPDRQYFYFATGGAEPAVQRLRFSDRQVETIASLKGLRRVVDKRGDVYSDQCRTGWLPGLHPRHRHPRNLRTQPEVAVSCSLESATRQLLFQR